MKTYLLSFIVFFTLHVSLQAQIIQMTEFDNFEMSYNANDPSEYNGTPYLDDDWHVVELTLRGNKKRYLKARYNIHEHFLELIMNAEHKYIKSEYIGSFTIVDNPVDTNTIYYPKLNEHNSDDVLEGLVQKTEVSPYSIASAYKTTLRKASKENPHLSTTRDHKGQMIILKKHYIYKDAEYHHIKKDKDLYKLFPEQEKKLKKYIKNNAIDIKSHEGLVAIMNFITTQ